MRSFLAGILCAVLALALALWLWPWQVEATGAPSLIEQSFMQHMLSLSLKRDAPRGANPFPPSAESLLAGARIFRDNCAGCHGDGVRPSKWGSTSFLPRAPQFASDPPHRPEGQIYWIVKHGIRNTGMGAWERLLTDEQIWKVTGFISHLESLPASPAAEWRKAQ
jgi:mono/diheme cytochrome c family protein